MKWRKRARGWVFRAEKSWLNTTMVLTARLAHSRSGVENENNSSRLDVGKASLMNPSRRNPVPGFNFDARFNSLTTFQTSFSSNWKRKSKLYFLKDAPDGCRVTSASGYDGCRRRSMRERALSLHTRLVCLLIRFLCHSVCVYCVCVAFPSSFDATEEEVLCDRPATSSTVHA